MTDHYFVEAMLFNMPYTVDLNKVVSAAEIGKKTK